MAVGDVYVFPGFLTSVLTQIFFPKPPTTFLTCFCRGERRKYAGKKSRFNRGSNSQPPGHESDTLTTEPPGRGSSNIRPYVCASVLQRNDPPLQNDPLVISLRSGMTRVIILRRILGSGVIILRRILGSFLHVE